MSIVARLVLLVALATSPILVAQLFTHLELWRERKAADDAEAMRYSRLVAADAERLIEGMRGILIAVSETPFVQRLDVQQCSSYLAGLAAHYPQLLNITLINAAGQPVCANSPIAPNATAIDRFYFQEAMRTDEFVIGEYIVGRSIPKPQLPVALPLRDDAGSRFVLSIGINLQWLQQSLGSLSLPPDTRVWIADKVGRVIAAPSVPDLVGHPLPAELQPVLGKNEGLFERDSSGGTPRLIAFQPLTADPVGLIVAVDLSRHELYSTLTRITRRDFGILLAAVIVAAVITAFGARFVLVHPLRMLTVAARQWSQGNFKARTSPRDRTSEIGQLGVAFDQMADTVERNRLALQSANESLEKRVAERTAELLAASKQLESEMAERQVAEASLRQAQKMEAIGQLTGGIAHDFNNLLTAIGGSIEFLIKALPAPNQRTMRYATLARESVKRASSMTHRLLAFARQQPLEMQVVDLNRLIAGMSDLLRRSLGETVAVETVLAGGLWLTRSDPAQLENALLNLAINARDAMPQGGRLTIETANAFLDVAYAKAHAGVEPGQYVMLAVSDTGTGMSPEVIARAFDPFFTTKAAGKGTGLGLSMIYGFAKQSSGHVKIYSELGQGTTIKLYLPRLFATTGPAPQPSAAPPISLYARNSMTVLVVEDDEAVLETSAGFLNELGYAVLTARDAVTALDLLRKHAEIGVLFTDVVLGGDLNGRELAEQACHERPTLRVLFTTGYTANAIIHGGILDPGVHLVPKPFTAAMLGAALHDLIDSPER